MSSNNAEPLHHSVSDRFKHHQFADTKGRKSKFRLDIKRKNLPIVAPFLWVKRVASDKVVLNTDKPDKLFKDAYMFISEVLHIPSLLNDTAAIMKAYTKSNGVLIYLVDTVTNQIYICPYLDDNTDETNRVSWNIREGSTIPAYVALTKETVIVNNMTLMEKFKTYDWKDNTVTGVLCVPIVVSDGSCYGVIELYRRNGIKYDHIDMKKVVPVSRLIATAVDNHTQRLNLQTWRMRFNYLLELTRYYFIHPKRLHLLVRDIVQLARKSLNSERGSYFVHDQKHHVLLSNMCTQYSDVYGNLMHRHKLKIQAIKERGIAELALRTGVLINVKDAYNDPRFDRENDERNGLITRSILCIPILSRNRTLGVLQLLNKRRGYYTTYDEEIFQLFSNFCSIAIEQQRAHEKSIFGQKWREIYNDCYFTQIMDTTTKPVYAVEIDATSLPDDFYDYKFYATEEDDLIKYACWIFRSLQIPDETCSNFIFSVRRGYRKNHYHNFEHAFNVMHTVACTINFYPCYFSYLERVALIISAICHDLDHRGVTNYFLEAIESAFVILYDESPLENHHYFMAMLIFDRSSLKDKFSNSEYKILSQYMREMILATDLTRHLQERVNIRLLCDRIQQDNDNQIWMDDLDNRRCVRNLIMTAADLSGMAKPFEMTKHIVKNIMQEFYEEGERLKQLGHAPLPITDIINIDKVPEFQIQFLDIVCLPCFELLKIILPEASNLFQITQTLRATWKELIKVRDSRK